MYNSDSAVTSAGADTIQQPLLSSGDSLGDFDRRNQFRQNAALRGKSIHSSLLLLTHLKTFIH